MPLLLTQLLLFFQFGCYHQSGIDHLNDILNTCPDYSLSTYTYTTYDISSNPVYLQQSTVQDDAPLDSTVLFLSNTQASMNDKTIDTQNVMSLFSEVPTNRSIRVLIDQDTTLDVVQHTLKSLYTFGLTDIWVMWAVKSDDQPTSPESEHLSRIQSEIVSHPPELRSVITVRNLESELRMCPSGQEILANVAGLPEDQKCEALIIGLMDSLPSCFLTNTNHVANYAQVLFTPRFTPNLFQLQLDPTAPLIDTQEMENWNDFLPLLIKSKESFWMGHP